MENKQKTFFVPLIIVGVMFAVLGFAQGINAFFIPFVKDAYHISTAQSYLILTASFSACVVFGIPSSMIIKKMGYKGGMVVSFLLIAAGFIIIVPAAATKSFSVFLLAIFVNSLGQVLLNVSINPYVILLGPQDSAASRISLIGIASKILYAGASFILAIFIDLSNIRLNDTVAPFIGLTIIMVVIGILSWFAPLPEVRAAGDDDDVQPDQNTANTKTSIFQFPHLLLGIVAIFLYVGVEQVALGSVNDYAKNLGLHNPENYVWFTSAGMVLGYILGIILIPKMISQDMALRLCALTGMAAILFIVLMPARISIYFAVMLGLANSLIWPSIWPLAIDGLGKFTRIGSSLLVLGIIGSAMVTVGFSWLAGAYTYQVAYWICMPSYIFIFYYAVWGHKIRI